MTKAQLEAENEKLKDILRKVFPEKSGSYFICGESGDKKDGLPETILICPSYGLDGFQAYVKQGRYTAPGW